MKLLFREEIPDGFIRHPGSATHLKWNLMISLKRLHLSQWRQMKLNRLLGDLTSWEHSRGKTRLDKHLICHIWVSGTPSNRLLLGHYSCLHIGLAWQPFITDFNDLQYLKKEVHYINTLYLVVNSLRWEKFSYISYTCSYYNLNRKNKNKSSYSVQMSDWRYFFHLIHSCFKHQPFLKL